MLKHNEIKKGKVIILREDPYEITKHSHVVKGRGKSVVQAELKNIRTGAVLQKTFHPGEEVEEADLEKRSAVFVYSHKGEYVFHEENNPSSRFKLDEGVLGERVNYLKEKAPVTTLLFGEKIINVLLPIKISLQVEEAPPGVKGNRSEGGTKVVTLETGKKIDAPLFIKEKDTVEVNTDTGEYVRRVQ